MKAPDWMSHLRTDPRGRPVPYVNVFGEVKEQDRIRIQFDRHVKRNAAFYLDAGVADPDFTRQSWQRQRECMLLGLCQVCGRPIPWSRRHLVISSVSVKIVSTPGPRHGMASVSEPWLDRRCAEFALKYCPALIRRGSDEDLQLIAVTDKRDTEIVLETGWVDGFPETQRKPVVLFAQLLVRSVIAVNA